MYSFHPAEQLVIEQVISMANTSKTAIKFELQSAKEKVAL
jgi:hypothetical protein